MTTQCLRGGSWLLFPGYLRSTKRIRLMPDFRLDDLGFRLVQEPSASRLIRGGSWHYDARHVRPAYRLGVEPGFRYGFRGFRIVVQS